MFHALFGFFRDSQLISTQILVMSFHLYHCYEKCPHLTWLVVWYKMKYLMDVSFHSGLCIDSVKMNKQNYNLIQMGMIFRPYQAWSTTKPQLSTRYWNSFNNFYWLFAIFSFEISFVSLRTWQMAIMEEAQAIPQFSLHSRKHELIHTQILKNHTYSILRWCFGQLLFMVDIY